MKTVSALEPSANLKAPSIVPPMQHPRRDITSQPADDSRHLGGRLSVRQLEKAHQMLQTKTTVLTEVAGVLRVAKAPSAQVGEILAAVADAIDHQPDAFWTAGSRRSVLAWIQLFTDYEYPVQNSLAELAWAVECGEELSVGTKLKS